MKGGISAVVKLGQELTVIFGKHTMFYTGSQLCSRYLHPFCNLQDNFFHGREGDLSKEICHVGFLYFPFEIEINAGKQLSGKIVFQWTEI